jgi:MATE family multidrug resistance protein
VKISREVLHSLRFDKREWFSFGKNSFDLFGRSAILSGSFFVAIRLASELGVFALASHQVILQAWLFISFFTDGLAITANIKGSQFYSQNNWTSLNLMANRLHKLSILLGVFFTAFGLIFSDFTQGLFTQDPKVLMILKEIWPLIMLAQPINCLAYSLDGVIFGLGGFHFLRKHMFIGVLVCFLPLAIVWKSLWGIWVGIFLLNIYRGASGLWFTRKISLSHSHG